MSSSHLISRTLKSLYMLCSMLAFCSMPLFAQTAESDPATSLPTTEAAGSSGRETQPHETGSVEASAPAMKDRIFLRQAVTHGMLQVKLSELAQQKAGGASHCGSCPGRGGSSSGR